MRVQLTDFLPNFSLFTDARVHFAAARAPQSRPLSTNAAPGPLSLPAVRRVLRHTGSGIARAWRASGLPEHWRFLLLFVLLSFLTAWAGTRAVMAAVDGTWTVTSLSAARHENQALRHRQELLRDQTATALAQIEAAEVTLARTP
ncbi:MAG: hypothetical protein ABI689_17705 [Thermoanaerobaculia bacterium]